MDPYTLVGAVVGLVIATLVWRARSALRTGATHPAGGGLSDREAWRDLVARIQCPAEGEAVVSVGMYQWDPDIGRLRDRLLADPANAWPALWSFLEPLPDDEERYVVLLEATDWLDGPDDAVVASVEGAADASRTWGEVFAAEYLLARGYRARGSGFADTVSESGWATLKEKLQEAAPHLRAALVAESEHPAVLAARLRFGLPGGIDQDEALACVGQLERVYPAFMPGLRTALQIWCAKWRGSHEAMFAFVDAVTRQAPAGDPRWSLVAHAHHERSSAFLNEDDPQGALAYLESPEVREALRHAWTQVAGDRDRLARRVAVSDLNLWAWLLSFFALDDCAMEAFERLGDRALEMPWLLSRCREDQPAGEVFALVRSRVQARWAAAQEDAAADGAA